MNNQTLRALKGSIAKWERIVNFTGWDEGSDNCPLCRRFLPYACNGCPVAKKAGEEYCNNTPYRDFVREALTFDEKTFAHPASPNSVKHAKQMLRFLKSLLPKEAA